MDDLLSITYNNDGTMDEEDDPVYSTLDISHDGLPPKSHRALSRHKERSISSEIDVDAIKITGYNLHHESMMYGWGGQNAMMYSRRFHDRDVEIRYAVSSFKHFDVCYTQRNK